MDHNSLLIADLKEQQSDKSAYVDHLQNETDFIIKTKNFGEKLDQRLKAKIQNCQKILKMQDDQIIQIASVRGKEVYYLTEKEKAPRRGRKTRARQYISKKWKKGIVRRFKFEFVDEQDVDLNNLCKIREEPKPVNYSPLSIVEEQEKVERIHYIQRTAKSEAPMKSYMRSTISRPNKSFVRSSKAAGSVINDNESVDSADLFKIDKELVKQNNKVNISMHQTNNSSRRGSRVRGQQIITNKT
jgi:hypothetical protein